MLNFRKLRQNFSSTILKEGKELYDDKKVLSAKILRLDKETIRISGQVLGNFNNPYENEIEIDRFETQIIHSNCDCSYRYDCQHLAAMIFFLEHQLDTMLVEFSKQNESLDVEVLNTIKEAETKQVAKQDAQYQKEVLREYIATSYVLSKSPFFLPKEENEKTPAEIAFIYNPASVDKMDFQLALRIPSRTKPLHVSCIKRFLETLRYEEPLILAGKRYFFSLRSFDELGQDILSIIMDHARFVDGLKTDKPQRIAQLDKEEFGMLLAAVFDAAAKKRNPGSEESEDVAVMPYLFVGSLEHPLQCSFSPASLRCSLDFLPAPSAKIFLQPSFIINQKMMEMKEVRLLECLDPGIIDKEVYYRFPSHIKKVHLQNLTLLRDLTIPEPLFGTFVENALPELRRFAEVTNLSVIEKFVTMPYVGKLGARCSLSFLEGELEAVLHFSYDGIEVPSFSSKLNYESISSFVTPKGILARNLVEEQNIIEDLFQDFIVNADGGTFVAKTEKKIVEFMTEVIPRNQHRVSFECPQNLLDQFIYDQTSFNLHLDYKGQVGGYEATLKVKGDLKGVSLDLLWDCIASRRAFIELSKEKKRVRKTDSSSLFSKILILDLEKIGKILQIFEDLGLTKIDDFVEKKPLWSLVNLDEEAFQDLPITFTMSNNLREMRKQILGEKEISTSPIPSEIKGQLRPYQKDGIFWLEKLRHMFLNGILADDMGLGKTLQAIVAITQAHKVKDQHSLIICPTSLLYNWKEEFCKFNPKLKVLVVDGIPQQRQALIAKWKEYDALITSYTLMQKDVDCYKEHLFTYIILDEAHHIKNKDTRNAKSVKMLGSVHKLILTGTPIENSLDDLWSLFDFLMPGLLSTYERFVDKYVRQSGSGHAKSIEQLKKKVSPFILRRMKIDVLSDLPPISEITYYCQLAELQLNLYKSFAKSAREELVKLVEKEGFDKVQIHVLATLTRLKQICCHPAIFAKEKAELGDSAKYEMLMELLQSLLAGGHKTVIFSQYTRMLQIIREDLEKRGVLFAYLDGSTKNRLQIVKDFNENDQIKVFLVSLRAGGLGLNIIGADTVIHYDMWWNPAVENQATDRVYRIGQKKSVSSYKLVTLGSIEEKIVELQTRKKGLVKKVVSCDDEAISKLTWEEVLELLQI
ncbi:MAG: SNF2-related protein [Chlamydiota bacterium]